MKKLLFILAAAVGAWFLFFRKTSATNLYLLGDTGGTVNGSGYVEEGYSGLNTQGLKNPVSLATRQYYESLPPELAVDGWLAVASANSALSLPHFTATDKIGTELLN